MTKRCQNCYKLNPASNNFCSSCGFPLGTPADPTVPVAHLAPPASSNRLGIVLILVLAVVALLGTAWLVSNLGGNSAAPSSSEGSTTGTAPAQPTPTDPPVLALLPTVTPVPASPTSVPVPTLAAAPAGQPSEAAPPPTVTPVAAPSIARTEPQTGGVEPSDKTPFSPYQLKGAYKRDDGTLYGRPEVALYGAGSGYNEGTVSVKIQAIPNRKIFLKLVGLDDEREAHCQLQVILNGTVVFDGPTTFRNTPTNDNGEGGTSRYWDEMSIPIPANALKVGTNTLTLRNTTNWYGYLGIPYILINTLDLVSQD